MPYTTELAGLKNFVPARWQLTNSPWQISSFSYAGARLALLTFLTPVFFCFGADYYFAPTSAGSNSGASCSNAYAYSDPTNGWNTSAKQTAGNKIHICPGTYSGAVGASPLMTISHSGSSGNPLTILGEPGSEVFSAPYWGGTGAIYINGNYVTLNGQGNITIENTLNGTSGGACLAGPCTTQGNTVGLQVGNTSGGVPVANVTVENFTMTHLYVHTPYVNDSAGNNSAGIQACANTSLITHITLDNVDSGISNGGCTGLSNLEISFSTITYSNHSVTIGINSGTVTGVLVHDNTITNAYNWDEPDNGYHHNGIFTFADPAGTITGQYYNNFIGGQFSSDTSYGASHTTALIFLEYDNANSYIFNNVLALSSGDLYGVANGLITIGGSSAPQYVYNNTFYETRDNGDECVRGGNNSLDFRNNVVISCGMGVSWSGTIPSFTADYNVYYGLHGSGPWIWQTDQFINFSQWKADCGCDAHSINGTSPNLDANFNPLAGSVAIGFGANLTSLGISALDFDKAGIARANTGNWTVGALIGSGATLPNSPTNLSVTAR